MQGLEKSSATNFSMICFYCGKLLIGSESWEKGAGDQCEMDSSSNSHEICPDCLLTNFPQEYLAIQEERRVRIKNIFKRGYQELYGHLVN